MASLKNSVRLTVLLLIFLCMETRAKLAEKEGDVPAPPSEPSPAPEVRTAKKVLTAPPSEPSPAPEVKTAKKFQMNEGGGAAMLFADELKQILERYLFGICPQTFKMPLGRNKNATFSSCDLDAEQQDLAGRFATLALRVHSAARTDCARLGAALANTLGELARTAASRHASNFANNEAAKKRKLSKSQKAKIQAKQRTALAVKKKAAALAAAAAAKVTTA